VTLHRSAWSGRGVSARSRYVGAKLQYRCPVAVRGWTVDREVMRVCDGPVYLADQGIEVCEACGGCTCCDHADVNHTNARMRCWIGRDGKCLMVGSTYNHDCNRDRDQD
jgi:hypothetical protein